MAMSTSICILGRQPALGLAELESLYGATVVKPISSHAVALQIPAEQIDFKRLGGATRLASLVSEVASTNWNLIEKALVAFVRSPSFTLPASGKFHLGISVIGFDVSPAKVTATGLTLKKIIRSKYAGSVRLVPNTTAALSSAQVFHNYLTGGNGCELLIIAHGNTTRIAQTTAVQDIDSYTLRDRGRPKRDARVGMLPPKLAQIIINLAAGKVHPSLDAVILDPFCGTGVLLQEALLIGYGAYGTDIEPRMINYSEVNLEWLHGKYPRLEDRGSRLEKGDATTHRWKMENGKWKTIVACETYLGRPFTTPPSREVLEQTVSEVNTILKKFLTNIRPQLAPGTRLCLAVPAWQVEPGKFRHLPLVDSLSDSGFERIAFKHTAAHDLLYYRENQIVGRELLVIQSKP